MDNNAKPITAAQVKKFQKEWQQALPNALPNLFFAYNGEENERVVSYCLEGKLLDMLLKMADKVKAKKGSYQLIVKLGLDSEKMEPKNDGSPGFVLMLQLSTKTIKFKQDTFLLQWVSNPQLPGSSTRNGVDAIPAEGAYLFVLNWLETAYSHLADPFEATAAQIGKRVKSYLFSPQESEEVIKALEKAGKKKSKKSKSEDAACLSVHLGKGMSVSNHPFGFRPVIEAGKGRFKTRMMNMDNGDDGNSFYDFSQPCPPFCDPD